MTITINADGDPIRRRVAVQVAIQAVREALERAGIEAIVVTDIYVPEDED